MTFREASPMTLRSISAVLLLLALYGCAVTTGPEHRTVFDGSYSLVLVYSEDEYESVETGGVDFRVDPDDQIEGVWWLDHAEGDDLTGEYDPETDGLYLTFTDGDTEHHVVGFVGPTGLFVAGHWTYWGTDGSWGNGLFRLDYIQ